MFRTRGFIFRKTVVGTGKVKYTILYVKNIFLKTNPRVRNM